MLKFSRGKKNKKYKPNGYWLDNMDTMTRQEYYEFITLDVLHCPFKIYMGGETYKWCANTRGFIFS